MAQAVDDEDRVVFIDFAFMADITLWFSFAHHHLMGVGCSFVWVVRFLLFFLRFHA